MIGRLTQRDPGEHHRVATPLELFIDLASVIAIAAAAGGLHHQIAEGHVLTGLTIFALGFFGVWWAWMNYTWFASAYDDGSVAFRLASFVFLTGSLVMSAGVTEFFDDRTLRLVVAGYVIMRLAMVYLWLAASRGDHSHSTTCRRYAFGIAIMQVYWILILIVFWSWTPLMIGLYGVGILGELTVPIWAERASMTPWHRHHMMERYGLLNIIVLGEALLATSVAFYAAMEHSGPTAELLWTGLSGCLIAYSLWWLYFSREDHLEHGGARRFFTWGYGHIFVFASGAALGAGFGVVIDHLTHHAHISATGAHLAVAIPAALYVAALWLVRDQFYFSGGQHLILPVSAVLCLVTPWLPGSLLWLAGILVVTAALRTHQARIAVGRRRQGASASATA